MSILERILNYDLIGKKPDLTVPTLQKIAANPPSVNTDWEKGFCEDFKLETKKFYARKQRRRCGYCRVLINPDGYTDPIEHITPRKLKPQWMFVQHNLVVSCGGCNSSKGQDNVLRQNENNYGNTAAQCPDVTGEYNIFNPHFDKWGEHFTIEDDFFLAVKPNTKGPATYSFCNMNRYHIIVDYADQLQMREPYSHRAIVKRIRKEKDPAKLAVLKQAEEYFLDMIEND